jgi:phosphoadenosine phosphosulfate reductase
MAGGKMQEFEFRLYPKYREAYIKAFERMLIARQGGGLRNTVDWESGEAVMDWWLQKPTTKPIIENVQMCLDDLLVI